MMIATTMIPMMIAPPTMIPMMIPMIE